MTAPALRGGWRELALRAIAIGALLIRSRRVVTVLILCLVAATGAWLIGELMLPEKGLQLEVRRGTSASGPVRARAVIRRLTASSVVDAVPGARTRSVSLRWHGVMVVDRDATWVFTVSANDPVTIVIDRTVVIDHQTRARGTVHLKAEQHDVEMWSAHPRGVARLIVLAAREGTPLADGLHLPIYISRTTEMERRLRALVDEAMLLLILTWSVLVIGLLIAVVTWGLRRAGIDLWPATARWAQALMLALAVWGINWGLPTGGSWAADEVTPFAVLRGPASGSEGWPSVYPPLHYYFLSSTLAPVAVLDAAGFAPWTRGATLSAWLAIRLLSTAFAVMLVGAVWTLAARMRPSAATMAAAGAALLMLLAY